MNMRVALIIAALLMGVSRADERPNVVLITIDDLNDWIGCLEGHPQARTPNIDRLARRGVVFSNAHCQSPVCNGSRVSFMTGRRPSSTGVYDNSLHFRQTKGLADVVTLSQHFAANGYETKGTGKIFHASRGQDEFQQYGPSGGQGPLPKRRLNCTNEATRSKLWDWGAFPASDDEVHDVINARWAATQIAVEREKPLFIAVGFYRPHVPMYAPEKWFAPFPRGEVKLPVVLDDDWSDIPAIAKEVTQNIAPPHAWFVEHGEWDHAVQSYLACVAMVDHCVGLVVDAIERSDQADNTWVVLLSDHGWHLGEKQRWAKQALWERATKVPLIIVPPKGYEAKRGLVTGKPVELLSIYPTLIEVCRLSARDGLEGRSLVPLITDADAADWRYPAVTTWAKNNHAVRSERWRYIRYRDDSEELYDHDADPNEWRNLAGDTKYADVIAAHRKWLPKVNVTAERLERVEQKAKPGGVTCGL